MSSAEILKEMKTKFPIGSKVIVKQKPEPKRPSFNWGSHMDKWIGVPMTIQEWRRGPIVYAKVEENTYNYDYDWFSPFEESVGCVCKSADLFVQGCTCGAIQRERQKK